MPFSTPQDLFPFFSQDFTAGTRPTLAQVTQFIADTDGELTLALTQCGFTVPPTEANLLLFLKNASRYGTLEKMEFALYAQKSGNKSERAGEYGTKYRAALDTIRLRPSTLGGPTRIDYVMPETDDLPVPSVDTVIY